MSRRLQIRTRRRWSWTSKMAGVGVPCVYILFSCLLCRAVPTWPCTFFTFASTCSRPHISHTIALHANLLYITYCQLQASFTLSRLAPRGATCVCTSGEALPYARARSPIYYFIQSAVQTEMNIIYKISLRSFHTPRRRAHLPPARARPAVAVHRERHRARHGDAST